MIYNPKLRRGKSTTHTTAFSAPTWLLHSELDEPILDLGFCVRLAAAVRSAEVALGSPTRRCAEQTGGFGCILLLAQDWAEWEATKRP